MVRVLFWNINRKPLTEPLRQLCDIHDADILVLAECRIPNTDLLLALNHDAARIFTNPINLSDRISFYSRLPERFVTSVTDADYWSIRTIDPPLGKPILLVAVHYPSKLYTTDAEQAILMPRLAEDIREAEQRCGHTRTVVVGDLNMNPFEAGICSAEGLHAVMCKRIAKKEKRTVNNRERRYFYNPMWNFLGDETPGPPGTYYYPNGITAYFWNTFDQVLFRPDLLDEYRENDVCIISECGRNSLLRNDRIASEFSDHLPLFFVVRT